MDYDVIIIGAGPAGYVGAIRGAQLGMRVAVAEKRLEPKTQKLALGGTCLNVGCIPSKAILDSSEHFERAQKSLAVHGIRVSGVELDLAQMHARKEKVVSTLGQGVAGLFKKHGIASFTGEARLLASGKVEVKTAEGPQLLTAKHVVLATGSKPVALPALPWHDPCIVDSTGALDFAEVPASLAIVGAGAIGLELGSVWRRLGSKVTLFEAMPDFLPAVDAQVSQAALKALRTQGLEIFLGQKVQEAKVEGEGVRLFLDASEGREEMRFDRVVVAVGRAPCTDGLGLEEAGVRTDQRGFVVVNNRYETSLPGVYAIGDVVGGPMLAHKASEEGIALMEMLAGQAGEVDYALTPFVIYTWPEIAWVGKSEQALKREGIAYRSGVFPFMASGRARAMGEETGMVKVLAEEKSDRLLGVHIFGPQASELIAEAVTAMAFAGTAEDLALIVHAHPTLAEALHEAALAVEGRSIHS